MTICTNKHNITESVYLRVVVRCFVLFCYGQHTIYKRSGTGKLNKSPDPVCCCCILKSDDLVHVRGNSGSLGTLFLLHTHFQVLYQHSHAAKAAQRGREEEEKT